MAVESRFVVIRNGVEVETFMDKKAADEYDKMLDMADNLSVVLENAPVELSEQAVEELSIYIAKQREDVLIALQAKKPKPLAKVNTSSAAEKPVTTKAPAKAPAKTPVKAAAKTTPAKTSKAKSKAKADES